MDTEEPLTLLPPEPPSAEEEFILNGDFVKGQFDYIKGTGNKQMLQTAYQAINILELWNFMKQEPCEGGFMWSYSDKVKKIYNKIEELGYTGHSGCSFGCVMRDMQSIAKHGEKQFRTNYLFTVKRKGQSIL